MGNMILAYIAIKQKMKETGLTQDALDDLKSRNKYCDKPCYKCDFWNECFYNYEGEKHE